MGAPSPSSSMDTHEKQLPTEPFEQTMRRGGELALEHMAAFFMKHDPVHHTLRKITAKLEQLQIPYAIADVMALNAHGYTRATVDVDILLRPEGLAAVHDALDGLGFLPPFSGAKQLRDVETSVRIEFLIAGQYPGDGKPKPVIFPDPVRASVEIDGIRFLSLTTLIELKLASGMTNAGRLKDLADVQELIKTLHLNRDFADKLDDSVRQKFFELWTGAQQDREL